MPARHRPPLVPRFNAQSPEIWPSIRARLLNSEERRDQILRTLECDHQVKVESLAARFRVSQVIGLLYSLKSSCLFLVTSPADKGEKGRREKQAKASYADHSE
jgi:hypothetical protein